MKALKPGIHHKIPMTEYLDDPGISTHGFKWLDISPRYFNIMRKQKSSESDAQRLGTAIHAVLLEPDTAGDLITVPPDSVLAKNGARSGNAWKQWKTEQDNAGLLVLTQAQWDNCMRMRESVWENPEHEYVREFLNGYRESTIIWNDPIYGFRRKCRPDVLPGKLMCVNLKSTRSAKAEKFGKDAINMKYHWSAALELEGLSILTGMEHRDYIFVCVENDIPFDVAVFHTPYDIIEQARWELEPLIQQYADCLTNDDWPGYPCQVQALYVPKWAYY